MVASHSKPLTAKTQPYNMRAHLRKIQHGGGFGGVVASDKQGLCCAASMLNVSVSQGWK